MMIPFDWNMRNFSEKWFSKCLNIDLKLAKAQTSLSMCAAFGKGVDFLSHLITVDKTWLRFYDPEKKQQSIE